MYKTLVDCQTLAMHLHDPQWVVVDCRFALTNPEAGRLAYDLGHIEGARYAHLNDDLSGRVTAKSGRHPLPDPHKLAATLGEWGIDNSKQVVAYDDSFGAMAARLWWLLRWLGHDTVALLDGGLPRWTREQRALTEVLPSISPVTFTPHVQDHLWVDSAAVARAVKQKDWLVIDARAEERFNGEIEMLDAVAGHIPGAINVPYEDNLHVSGRFSSQDELRELYEGLIEDVRPEQVIQMCGSGVTACHNILAMEQAGLTGAKLYAGSWSEWIRDPARPVAHDD